MLPRAAAVAKYLELLDESRTYSNRGELLRTLEARLGTRLGAGPGHLLAAGSGTAALTSAILAVAGRGAGAKPYCLCPGYTFVAGPLAAEQCGYRPHFVDVDPETWAIDPERLAGHRLLDQAGVVMVAAPYGRAFSQSAWARFAERTGVPVVIDAAAGVELFADGIEDLAGPIPVVLSLHATKPFATGEGGAIVCTESSILYAAAASINFGFSGTRQATGPGFNGKMSEYHAAVGLAELDGWDLKRAALLSVSKRYRSAAAERGVTIHAAPGIGSNYVLFEASSEPQAMAAPAALSRAGIDHRLWYGMGLHREPYFRNAAHDALPGVESIAPRLIGLPVAHDLADDVVDGIVAALPSP